MRKYNEIRIPDWKLEEWNELTEWNAHGKRIERIADYCQAFADEAGRADLYEITATLNAINCLHDRRGYISDYLYELRRVARERLRKVIGEQFGPEVLERIDP